MATAVELQASRPVTLVASLADRGLASSGLKDQRREAIAERADAREFATRVEEALRDLERPGHQPLPGQLEALERDAKALRAAATRRVAEIRAALDE